MPDAKKPECTCGCLETAHYSKHAKKSGAFSWRKGPCTAYQRPGVLCTCRRYAPAMSTSRRRSIRKQGISAQRQANLAAGFQPCEGHGKDGIYYGPDGFPVLISESKQQARFPWGEIEKALRQAESYCLNERGKPFGVVLYTTKPGTGKAARRYLILRADEWQAIAERLVEPAKL